MSEGHNNQEPSPAQARVLEVIKELCRDLGHSPTLAAIGKALGGHTPQTVAQHVGALERKGFIRRKRGEARTIVPVIHTPQTQKKKQTKKERERDHDGS